LSQALDFEDTCWFVKRIQLTTNSQESVFGFLFLTCYLLIWSHKHTWWLSPIEKGNLSGSSFI